MLEKIAAWLQIVTAPITIAQAIVFWSLRVPELGPSGTSDIRLLALAIAATVVTETFFFVGQFQLALAFSRRFSDRAPMTTISVWLGLAAIGFMFFLPVELMVLDILVPQSSFFGPILFSAVAWALGAVCSYFILFELGDS